MYNKQLLVRYLFLQKIFNLHTFRNNSIHIKTYYRKKKIFKYKKNFRSLIKFFLKLIKRLLLSVIYKLIITL
jgi:hypothetical protein